MAKETQNLGTGSTVRIWTDPKIRLQRVREAKAKKERRIVSEAELVSKAVDALCTKEERKLGIA